MCKGIIRAEHLASEMGNTQSSHSSDALETDSKKDEKGIHSNKKRPLARATKKSSSEAGFRFTNGNVIAIDFGTTGISVAYTTEAEKDNITIRVIDKSQHKLRVCNAILMKSSHSTTYEVVEIGEAARDKYKKLKIGKIIYLLFLTLSVNLLSINH